MTRFFDIFFSGLALIVLAPLLLPIMLILKLTGEHKVFYLQERVGKDGKMFGIWKFATMLENSPNMKNAYITTHGDPRVLPFGRFLRKSKINELPQLVNIVKGDLSVVGPRPQVKAHLDLYPKDKLDDILSIQPGLTGIASLFFRDEETMMEQYEDKEKAYIDIVLPQKIELYNQYIDTISFKNDFKLILQTVKVI